MYIYINIYISIYIYIYIYIYKYLVLFILRHPFDKAGSTMSFSSEDAFPSVSLSAKNPKLFIDDSDSKENENNVDITG